MLCTGARRSDERLWPERRPPSRCRVLSVEYNRTRRHTGIVANTEGAKHLAPATTTIIAEGRTFAAWSFLVFLPSVTPWVATACCFHNGCFVSMPTTPMPWSMKSPSWISAPGRFQPSLVARLLGQKSCNKFYIMPINQCALR